MKTRKCRSICTGIALFSLLIVVGAVFIRLRQSERNTPLQVTVPVKLPGLPWDFRGSTLPVDELIPAQKVDGIPTLGRQGMAPPLFVPAVEVDFLKDNERVIGVVLNGQAKAYPLKILQYHECVNDFCGGEPIAVTW